MTTKKRPIQSFQPSTTPAKDDNIPSIKECSDAIKAMSHNSNNHTKELAQLFTSCIALLIHLDADRAYIEASTRDMATFPDDVPAINTVLGDRRLFQALLHMLHTPINSAVNVPPTKRNCLNKPQGKSSHHHYLQQQTMHNTSRKRAFSLDTETPNKQPNKAAKKILSPKISGNKEAVVKVFTTNTNTTTTTTTTNSPKIPVLNLSGASSHNHEKQSPLLQIPFSVVAATIFYSALRHVDQWPAVLVKAYAEDSFGARLWVDDERCHLFTKNLELVLTEDSFPSSENLTNNIDEGEICRKLSSTPDFVTSFHNFFSVDNDDETCTPEDPAHKPAHLTVFPINKIHRGQSAPVPSSETASSKLQTNHSSGSSSDSDSSGDEECVLEVSVGSVLKFTTPSLDGQFDDPTPPTTTRRKSKSLSPKSIPSSDGGTTSKNVITELGKNGRHNDSSGMLSINAGQSHTSTVVTPFHHKTKKWWWYCGLAKKSNSRYIGTNKELAHKMIGEALSNRLSAKGVKQNSKFLSTLPSFVSLPEIRKLTAEHLEKWLQSPAVSLLAQSLLSNIVAEMKNVDPPLKEDIFTIDSILSMNLKGNQFNCQKESVTSIVKSIPTAAISSHLVSRLLSKELECIDDKEIQIVPDVSENLEMFSAVYTALHPTLAYNALADFMLLFLNKVDQSETVCNSRVNEITNLLRRVVNVLRSKYDGLLLVKAILERDWNGKGNYSDEQLHDVARIVFESVTLMAPHTQSNVVVPSNRSQPKVNRKGPSFRNEHFPNNQSSLQAGQLLSPKLLKVRKVILKWCLYYFITHFQTEQKSKSRTLPNLAPTTNLTEGAGIPDYASVLDGRSKSVMYSSNNPRWILFMRTLRCLLFIEKPDSTELLSFLAPNFKSETQGFMTDERAYQILMCCDYGADVDNEIIRLIFEAVNVPLSPLDAPFAISLIEHLFHLCREGQKATIKIDDCNIIWDLYSLAEYIPLHATSSDHNRDNINSDSDSHEDEVQNFSRDKSDIPRLAYPGLWWRVTVMALTVCSKSPQVVGAKLYDRIPTLGALIKMTTAEKYRYPTSDCNDMEREATKKNENKLREQEFQITEALFFPSAKARKTKTEKDKIVTPSSGLRVSARQREKQEKIKANQRKKEMAQAATEARRRKKLVRSAQKSIMLWDPTSSARKPPKESVDLILSARLLFDLSNAFQKSTDPDFILRTIGSNSRDSIERAYDWLIPIVSSHPNVISRLPPSASCYLLLRVFACDTNGNNQLLKLSAPLLKHVTDCLKNFGQEDAQRAGDILFFDIADQNPDRRRCARRALHETLGELEDESNNYQHVITGKLSCLLTLLHTKHSIDLATSAVRNLSRALVFERGGVLRAYILALHHYSERVVTSEPWNFASVLCDLLSARPHVCRALIDRFTDVRDLTIQVVHNEFNKCISRSVEEDSNDISMFIYVSNDEHNDKSEIKINLPLLRACIVLITNWRDNDESITKHDGATDASRLNPKDALMSLVNYLIPSSIDGLDKVNTSNAGAASAQFVDGGRRGVSVEEWVMLAKSRCDFIARHSALSAPDVFLPRLLLCCGLPQSSLLSMIERLGQLGDESLNHDKTFVELLSPSATTEWGLGQISKRNLITRKLLGRITADINILCSKECCETSVIDKVASSSFVSWLEKECENGEDKLRKSRSRKKAKTCAKGLNAISRDLKDESTVSAAFSAMFDEDEDHPDEGTLMHDDFRGNVIPSLMNNNLAGPGFDASNLNTFIFDIMHSDFTELDSFIGMSYAILVTRSIGLQQRKKEKPTGNSPLDDIKLISNGATQLLLRYRSLHVKPVIFTRIVLKWVPILSEHCEESFWEILFSKRTEDDNEYTDTRALMVTKCTASWSASRTMSCQSWILRKVIAEELGCFSISSFLKCLVHKTGQVSSLDVPLIFRNTKEDGNFLVIRQQSEAVAAFRLALDGAKSWYKESEVRRIVTEGNLLPDWMVLMLLIGRQGKKHLDLITTMLVDMLPSNDCEGQFIPGILLRLYSQFPSSMNLNNGKTRQVLVNTAAEMASDWLKWRIIFDERIQRMIYNLVSNPNQRQQQLLNDVSKRHPLIACRHISSLADSLLKDAAVDFCRQDPERKGNTVGSTLSNTAIAQLENSEVNVIIIQWGYEFTEALWGSTLDILIAIPEEVIFVCGHQMGLIELLNLYLKLIYTQIFMDIVSPNPAIVRIRDKFLTFINSFHTSNHSKCELWLESEMLGVLKSRCTVKDVFSACDMKLSNNFDDAQKMKVTDK